MLNQYTSTYQKDYTWPHVSGVRRLQPLTVKVAPCTCIDSQLVFKELLDLSEKSFDWSRMGPMGRLLEPKLYPTKIELISETDTKLFDQPCTFLQKLQEPCSGFKMLKKSLLDETSARVDADRMKTTYQVDYSDPAERMAQRDKALAGIDDQRLQCSIPIKITIETDYLPHCRSPPSRYNGNMYAKKRDYKRKNGLQCKKKEIDERRFPSWKSEYQDNISRIGQNILRAKLHHTKKNIVPTWVTSN